MILKERNKGIKFTSLESDNNFNTNDNKNITMVAILLLDNLL